MDGVKKEKKFQWSLHKMMLTFSVLFNGNLVMRCLMPTVWQRNKVTHSIRYTWKEILFLFSSEWTREEERKSESICYSFSSVFTYNKHASSEVNFFCKILSVMLYSWHPDEFIICCYSFIIVLRLLSAMSFTSHWSTVWHALISE